MSNEAEREAFYAYGESIGMPRLMLTIGEFKAFQAGAAWQRTQAQPSEKLVEALEEVITYPESGHEHELRSLLAASPKTESQPISEKRVSKMARILSERFARDYDVDIGDHWTLHGTELIEDVHAMLEGSKGDE